MPQIQRDAASLMGSRQQRGTEASRKVRAPNSTFLRTWERARRPGPATCGLWGRAPRSVSCLRGTPSSESPERSPSSAGAMPVTHSEWPPVKLHLEVAMHGHGLCSWRAGPAARAVQACGDTGCGGLTMRRPGQGAGVRKVFAYFPDCQSLRTSFCPPGAFRKHTLWASPQALPLSGTFVLETPGSGPGSSSLFIYSPLRVLTPFLNSVC